MRTTIEIQVEWERGPFIIYLKIHGCPPLRLGFVCVTSWFVLSHRPSFVLAGAKDDIYTDRKGELLLLVTLFVRLLLMSARGLLTVTFYSHDMQTGTPSFFSKIINSRNPCAEQTKWAKNLQGQ